MKQFMTVCMLMFALVGCSHKNYSEATPNYLPKYNTGLYVYRLNSTMEPSRVHEIYLDGKKIGSLKNGGFITKQLDPGAYLLTIKNVDSKTPKQYSEMPITITKNQIRYIEVQWAPSGLKKRVNRNGYSDWLPHYSPKLAGVSAQIARLQLRALRYQPATS